MMYLLLANLYLCVFYGFYYVFLRRETFFQGNRIYLLAGLLLAFTLPLAEHGEFDNTVVYQYHLPVIHLGDATPEQLATGVTAVESPTSIRQYLSIGYVIGCLIAALFVVMQFVYTISALRKRHPGQAYSFFNRVRIDQAVYGSHQIINHEQVHVRQWHSADIVMMQVVKILNWFNPVIYFYERALRLQHEYIADGKTAANDQLAYAELLVSRAMGLNGPVLANSFSNKTLLKRRLTMLLRDKSSKYSWFRYAFLLPIVIGMVIFSIACNHQGKGGAAGTTSEKSTAATESAHAFKKELGMWVAYGEEALRSGTQGVLAFTFEKSKAGRIEDIQFLNELGSGQEAEVIKALQRENVERVAPIGKYMVSISFRISGVDPTDMPPPPPPVSSDYTSLGEVVIVGYAPELPPPPPVEPPTKKEAGSAAAKAEKQYPEPTVVQVKVAPSGQGSTELDPNQLFQSVEIDPNPPGGMAAFMQYIGANYDYPQAAIEAGVNGQVQVAFVVEKDGSLTDLKVIKDLKYGTGEAAIRVLQSSSKWSPGIQNGRAVRVAYTLPIRLNLQQ
ncbi:M56 family metallopeptidase [Parapedobacter pyrenivorans]|uniref:M56 family metallopeptidase n=1 Tax=Parapedobacter pyrenivorans TaxID=1305674 RepID=UPI00333EE972